VIGSGEADWQRSLDVLHSMARPTVGCFNLAIATCARADKWKEVSMHMSDLVPHTKAVYQVDGGEGHMVDSSY
jgi:hypothetical protein